MWTPQPRQRLALMSTAFELLFGGARGGGKSDFLLADYTRGLQYGSAYSGILFRHTYPQLEELIKRSYDLYKPLGATFNQKDNIWKFPGGSTVKMRPLDSDADVQNYQGHQYQYLGWDELTLWASDYAYTTMYGTVRSAKGVPCFIRAATNPKGPGHSWVKQRFIDPAPPMTNFLDKDTGLKRVFIPSTIDDNMELLRNDPTYADRLKALPPALYKAFRHGDWDSIDGQYFEEFNRTDHVVDPFKIPKGWKRFVTLDWGYAKPYAMYWIAVDYDGRGWIYREMYGTNGKADVGSRQDAEEVAKIAWQASIFEDVKDLVADPAIWVKTGSGQSIAEQFKKVGFRMHKGINDRKSGAMRVHQVLKQKEEERPMIQIFNTCTHLIRTLPGLGVDPSNNEDVDTKQEDHAYDSLRYGAMSQFWKPTKPITAYKKSLYDPMNYGVR